MSKTEEFKLLTSMLKEQKKSSKNISPNSLQNHTDPEATYRKKGKKKHIGYTANIVEWSSPDKTDIRLSDHGHFFVFLRTVISDRRM